MKNIAVTISKLEESTINEDAVKATDCMIAVSDGAGGGGVYAERWSAYLVNHLPEIPIKSFEELDSWIEEIWEPFYNACEETAKQEGGMLLDKFYDEGSFATLEPSYVSQIIKNLKDIIEDSFVGVQMPIILTSPIVRIYFKKMIEQNMPNLKVLSYNEIDSNVEIQSIGMVSVNED